MTDYDDFPRPIATMYGMAPITTSPRVSPAPWGAGTTEPTRLETAPTDGANLIFQLQTRAEWLRKQLKMQEAWRLELAIIERMLAVYQPAHEKGDGE